MSEAQVLERPVDAAETKTTATQVISNHDGTQTLVVDGDVQIQTSEGVSIQIKGQDVTVSTPGTVRVVAAATQAPEAAPEAAVEEITPTEVEETAVPALEIGAVANDGAICADKVVYGGDVVSEKQIFVAPADAPRLMTLDEAVAYAAQKSAATGENWHVPTQGELKHVFNTRAATNAFNPPKDDFYWSHSGHADCKDGAFVQKFTEKEHQLALGSTTTIEGVQGWKTKDHKCLVRLVRN